MDVTTQKIAVIGLGYVGLPVAVYFAKHGFNVVGFDINITRINELRHNIDITHEIDEHDVTQHNLLYTADTKDLADATIYIVTVPTPITNSNMPDLTPLISATNMVGAALKKGDIVIYESTVYPGATEEECVPILEQQSSLVFTQDFQVGYSPERINPGDKEHSFDKIAKVVSASNDESLDIIAKLYGSVISANIHKAPSIKVAEAAKVIENTQRDVNIALINELALIFDKMNIATDDVLKAAGTKWNFLPFKPGLVGGHCIGVDPYYLTYKAETLGYTPEVILAGRRTNNYMGPYIAQKLIHVLSTNSDKNIADATIAILGLTFKENVPDYRNSRVFDIIDELAKYNITPIVHDVYASDTQKFDAHANIVAVEWDNLRDIDALIIAVPHQFYIDNMRNLLYNKLHNNAIIIDIKSCVPSSLLQDDHIYWAL